MKKALIYKIVFAVLVGMLIVVPEAKTYLIKGLMEIGLFKPAIFSEKNLPQANLSDLTFKNAKGDVLNLGNLTGKIIFLNFWATWCPPCLAELPSIEKFYQNYKKDPDLAFVTVDADGDFAKTAAFMKRKGYTFPVYGFAGKLPESVFSGSLPTTLVFDKKGRISMHQVGAANYTDKKFVDFITRLKAL